MDLYLQIGHGMMGHCYELIQKWGEGTAIISPKNMTHEQILTFSNKIAGYGGDVLIDPQFYIPRTSQENLQNHSFWPNNFDTATFFNGSGIDRMIDILVNDYIAPSNASGVLIPSLYLGDEVSNDWDAVNSLIINSLDRHSLGVPRYLTLCIGVDILKSEEKIHELIELIEDYQVDGYYIIPVHPNNDYLVDDMTWLLNLIDLVAGLKLCGKKVIVGYCSHQMLALGLAKVDAICSGIWLKTRVFPLGDFDEDDEPGFARRRIWYYCPQALTEYQIPTLDVAHRTGLIDQLETDSSYLSNYSDPLFSGAQPTTVAFPEPEAFRHYLQCLKVQCKESEKATYEDTKEYLNLQFETAADLTEYFRSNGIRGRKRDFSNVADSNLALLDAFNSIRGLVYKTTWNSI